MEVRIAGIYGNEMMSCTVVSFVEFILVFHAVF